MQQDIYVDIHIDEGIFVSNKNVFTKMDTYCAIEIGRYRLETNLCVNGGREPKWNYSINNVNIPYDIDHITLKAYNKAHIIHDECLLTIEILVEDIISHK